LGAGKLRRVGLDGVIAGRLETDGQGAGLVGDGGMLQWSAMVSYKKEAAATCLEGLPSIEW